jgi:hypothetical protein
MDKIAYSLNDIFGLLHESTQLLGSKNVIVSSGDSEKTQMSLAEYIAMSVATQLVSETSRMATNSGSMATKDDVEAALRANHWSELTFPNYEYAGLTMLGGSRRKTRRRK